MLDRSTVSAPNQALQGGMIKEVARLMLSLHARFMIDMQGYMQELRSMCYRCMQDFGYVVDICMIFGYAVALIIWSALAPAAEEERGP